MVPWRVTLVVVALFACLGFFVWLFSSGEKLGAREALDQIRTQNMEAGNAGENARYGRRDCVAGGMRWDFARGECDRDP